MNLIVVEIIAVLLAIVFFVYLVLRRTVLGFKEGMRDGKR